MAVERWGLMLVMINGCLADFLSYTYIVGHLLVEIEVLRNPDSKTFALIVEEVHIQDEDLF